MTIYYKGKLIDINDIEELAKNIYFSPTSIGIEDCYPNDLSLDEKRYIRKQLRNLFDNAYCKEDNKISDDKSCNILNKYFSGIVKEIPIHTTSYDIIGEKIVDENGDIYIKEYHSGLLFPIALDKNRICDYYIFRDYYNNELIKLEIKYDIASLLKTSVLLFDIDVANINEVNEYKNKFNIKKNLFNRGKDKDQEKCYIKGMTILYNKNVFDKEIIPVREEKKIFISQSREVKIMENIEYLLDKLEKINKIKYLELKNKYENMLKENSGVLNVNSLSLKSLIFLETEIEFYLNNRTDNIKEYLNRKKDEYLNNFINGNNEKTKITIDDLDKITGLFLSKKREYPIIEQREVIRNISLIYLLEMIENKDELDFNKLENSYIKEFIKTIYIEIKVLIKEGIIESDYLFDINNDITLNDIINIIENIEIKYKEVKK